MNQKIEKAMQDGNDILDNLVNHPLNLSLNEKGGLLTGKCTPEEFLVCQVIATVELMLINLDELKKICSTSRVITTAVEAKINEFAEQMAGIRQDCSNLGLMKN